jgi:hypothetical protein
MERVAAPLLARVLEAAGYRLSRTGAATVAVRGSDHRAVVLASGPVPVAQLETAFPPQAVRRTIVYEADPGPLAREEAARRGIEILDPWTLGPGLGELVLTGPAVGEPSADEGPEPLELPFPLVRPEACTVRPRVERSDVESLGAVEGAHCTLRLVPYYVSAYRVRPATAAGGRGAVVQRLVAVNATTRVAEIWDDRERELVEGVPGPHQVLAPQLAEREVPPIALEAVRRHHTVRVDHTEQHEGALVIETRRVVPELDDVRLGPFLLVYVPHWYIEGTRGRIVVDAVSGRRKGEVEESD